MQLPLIRTFLGFVRELGAGLAGVVSFGLCGALAPELEVGDLVSATAVVTSEGEFAVEKPTRLSGAAATTLRHCQ